MTPGVLIGLHEYRHTIGAAVALVHLGLSRRAYDRQRIWLIADDDGGEFALMRGRGLGDLRLRALQLCAFAPLAGLPEAPDLIRRGEVEPVLPAWLSGPDIELARDWKGDPMTPALIVAACQQVEDKLGLIRLMTISALIDGMAFETVEDLPRLEVFLPYSAARQALDRAHLNMERIAA